MAARTRCSPAVSLKPFFRESFPSASCIAARADHAAHQSSQRSSEAVTSSKSASSTPFETKRGAQWEIAEETFGSFATLDFLQCGEDFFGGERHAAHPRREGRQGVVDGVHHRGRRRGGAGFADAFGAELGLAGGRLEVRA